MPLAPAMSTEVAPATGAAPGGGVFTPATSSM